MKVKDLPLSGLKLIEPVMFKDNRGFFIESYREPRYFKQGICCKFVQDNLAFSFKGAIRGMHFQKGQDKLVSVLSGKILDVAVDIRPNSLTFGQYHCEVLDDLTRAQFFIPDGFAHGYAALSETCLVQYKVSGIYDPKVEGSFRFDDQQIGIDWPAFERPIISDKDLTSPLFSELNFQKCYSKC